MSITSDPIYESERRSAEWYRTHGDFGDQATGPEDEWSIYREPVAPGYGLHGDYVLQHDGEEVYRGTLHDLNCYADGVEEAVNLFADDANTHASLRGLREALAKENTR